MAAPLSRQSLRRLLRCKCSAKRFRCLYISRSLTFTSSRTSGKENADKPKSHSEGETHFGYQSVAEKDKVGKAAAMHHRHHQSTQLTRVTVYLQIPFPHFVPSILLRSAENMRTRRDKLSLLTVVYEVFENVASKYDVMNDAMSGGIHRVWKDHFIDKLSPSPGTKLLDVAGGTGDIAFRFLRRVGTPTFTSTALDDFEMPRDVTAQVYMDPAEALSSSSSSSSDEDTDSTARKFREDNYMTSPDAMDSHVTVSDINEAMLDEGRKKSLSLGYTSGISWVQANAETLPMPDNSFDAYTIAFGIRNCTHVQEVLNEAYRVLKPGGRFMCLEFSEVKNPLIRSLYDTYSFQVIPVMGQVIAGDWKSYQYLVESIRQFPNQEDFAAMIKSAGFRMVTYENLTFGVAAIHSGYKI